MTQMFFYSEQIRRFLLQFIRVFSNFQVEYGKDADNNVTLLTVPVKYGDSSRMVSNIIRDNSENKIIPTPMISCYITDLEYSRDRIQSPTFIDKRSVRMRKIDPDTGAYTTEQGNTFSIERHMPVPYDVTMSVDIWTSNTTQKLQLIEQFLVLFNPSVELQSTDNYFDWGSLSLIELTNIQWTSRNIPVGTEDDIDIASLRFKMPIWLSPPAKLKKLGVITKLVASLYDGISSDSIFDDSLLISRQKFTPMNFGILLIGNSVSIVELNQPLTNQVPTQSSILNDPAEAYHESSVTWKTLINQYGSLQDGLSEIRLELDDTSQIIGTVAYDEDDPKKLEFTVNIDTIPVNNLDPIDKIINPQKIGPGAGLPVATTGDRYLILNSIGNEANSSGPAAWKSTSNVDFYANANDIIEYNGAAWTVVFDSATETSTSYVTNLTTGIQYKWKDGIWTKSYEGFYPAGSWSLVI